MIYEERLKYGGTFTSTVVKARESVLDGRHLLTLALPTAVRPPLNMSFSSRMY